MADTIEVSAKKEDGWIEVAAGDSGGFFTAYSGFYCEYAGQPPANLSGHRFSDHPLRYDLDEGNSLYFRTDKQKSFIQITPD